MNYIAVYKGPADDLIHKIGHWSICLWTRSKYSHCEVVIDGYGYSSSGRDGGVRKKLIDFDSGKWDLIPVPNLDTLHVLNFYNQTKDDDYDYRGLAWFVAPFVKDHKTRWFCSEWTAVALKLEKPQQYHIQDIVNYLKKTNG